MGAAAPIIGGVLGLAGAGLTAYSMSKMMKNNQSQQMSMLQQLQNDNFANAQATLPKTPEAPTGNAADAATNEAEAERQKQLKLLAANEKLVNPTGGLGVTQKANTKKRTLGGGV